MSKEELIMSVNPDGTATINATIRMLTGYFNHRGFSVLTGERSELGMHVLSVRKHVGKNVVGVQWAISHLDLAALPADRFFELADQYIAQLFTAIATHERTTGAPDIGAWKLARQANAGLKHWYVESLPDGFENRRREYEGYDFDEMQRRLALLCVDQTIDKIFVWRDGELHRHIELK